MNLPKLARLLLTSGAQRGDAERALRLGFRVRGTRRKRARAWTPGSALAANGRIAEADARTPGPSLAVAAGDRDWPYRSLPAPPVPQRRAVSESTRPRALEAELAPITARQNEPHGTG
jgi:hypothetical protein